MTEFTTTRVALSAGVRLDLDASVSALGELVDAPVVTFALGEDHIEVAGDEAASSLAV
ncbi:hypothetical protein ACWC9R_29040 [Streptomyces sp. NPDC001219]